ncbi:MAG TPA: GNAT family N-acetyltransferase [Thermoguttaceae bacterium]|mgnify:CR=1 FL=1|nr:GNAT family N-acetyltransferase [Thermoguttaceae bacterium]
MKYMVDWLTRGEQLAEIADIWNRLAGPVPFRRWEWLAGWWRCYGQPNQGRRRLAVGVVKDPAGEAIGLAPWYIERSAIRGRVLRFLGGDEVCSDHLNLLCLPGREDEVAEALAQWLNQGSPDRILREFPPSEDAGQETDWTQANVSPVCGDKSPIPWDLIELAYVDADDPTLEIFLRCMARQGCWIERAPVGHCWVIELPDTWEAFLQRLSNHRRRRLRQVGRLFFTTGRAVVHTVRRPEELPKAMDLLVQLHRQRRRQLGQPDCFVSSRFETFHRQIAPELLAAGLLELHWLEVDGQPTAAEYHLLGDGTIYVYQSGIAPTAECPSPGEWIYLALVRRAIERGCRYFDLLRGDEAYKAHWRATPRRLETLWIAAPHLSAGWRYGIYRTGRRVKQWLRRWLGQENSSQPLSSKEQSGSTDALPSYELASSARGENL